MGSAPKVPQPENLNIPKSLRDYVGGLSQVLPRILQQEQRFRPEFTGLNLQDVQSMLMGGQGQMGLLGLTGRTARQTRQLLQREQIRGLQGMQMAAPAARGLAQVISPEAAAQVQSATEAARRSEQAAMGLTGQEMRDVQQQAREAAASAGRLGGNAAIAAELLGRDVMLGQKRAEAAQARQQAFGLGQQFYSAPAYAQLGSTPLSYTAGMQQMGAGLGAIGAGTPQLFNIGQGLGIGAANLQNQMQAQIANQQAATARQAGLMNMIGNVAGSAAGVYALSDMRTKTNIKKVGTTDNGLPVYTYNYKTGGPTQMGVMAQDVEKVNPRAVANVGGLKMVNYGEL